MSSDPGNPPHPNDSNALFDGLLLMAPEAIFCVDSDQRILTFNPGAEAIFGYSAADVVGGPLEVLIPPRFRQAHHHNVRSFAGSEAQSRAMGQRGMIRGLRRSGEEFPGCDSTGGQQRAFRRTARAAGHR